MCKAMILPWVAAGRRGVSDLWVLMTCDSLARRMLRLLCSMCFLRCRRGDYTQVRVERGETERKDLIIMPGMLTLGEHGTS